MKYAKENNIVFRINRSNDQQVYPLLHAIKHNNKEIVKILIEYAKENNLVLEMNSRDNDGYGPLEYAIRIPTLK